MTRLTVFFTPFRNRRLRKSAITVAKTSGLPTTGWRNGGADDPMDGKTSTAVPAMTDNEMISVCRASSNREVMICNPLIIMKLTANNSAATITGRGINPSSAGNFGRKPIRMKMIATANATRRLATPVAAAKPTAGVEVLVPRAPAAPASKVDAPSASTPAVTDFISGRTQSIIGAMEYFLTISVIYAT